MTEGILCLTFTFGFLMFPASVERDEWQEMGY